MIVKRIKTAVKNLIRRELLRDPFLLEVKRWFRDGGDSTLRLDYPLRKDSVVLDIGGYKGDFAFSMHSRYGCKVNIFEPHPSFYVSCIERFKNVPEIRCLNYGLGSRDGTFGISDLGDASSFVRPNDGTSVKSAELRSIADVWAELCLKEVDLLKINIEGGEYDVLPALIEAGLVRNVKYLQIQFHNFIDDSVQKRELIRKRLAETHEEMWNYEFVWESWRRK